MVLVIAWHINDKFKLTGEGGAVAEGLMSSFLSV